MQKKCTSQHKLIKITNRQCNDLIVTWFKCICVSRLFFCSDHVRADWLTTIAPRSKRSRTMRSPSLATRPRFHAATKPLENVVFVYMFLPICDAQQHAYSVLGCVQSSLGLVDSQQASPELNVKNEFCKFYTQIRPKATTWLRVVRFRTYCIWKTL